MLLTDEKNIKKTNLESVLWATNYLMCYIDEEEGQSGETYWEDKDGDGFEADMGYLWEGLRDMRKYAKEKLDKYIAEE